MSFWSSEQSASGVGHFPHLMSARTVSALVAGALVVLLIVFFAVTMINMRAIILKVDDINEHPYPVTIAAGQVETHLVQLRTLAERLEYTRTPEAIDRVETEYALIDGDLYEPLNVVDRCYDVAPNEAMRLKEQYELLVIEQQHLIALCRDASVVDAQIEEVVSTRIDPLVTDMIDRNANIIEGASQSFASLYDLANTASSQTIAYANTLLVSVLVALVVFLLIIRRKDAQQQLLQKSLEKALAEARHANQAKSQFLAGVSHDIRTPCSAIVGLTEIAQRHAEEPDRVRECLDKISLSSHHLLNLINDVLDMSKIESGQITLVDEPFDMRELLIIVETIVTPQAKTKNIAFEMQVTDLGSNCISGDALRLKQVLLNLLSNAIKYTEPSGQVNIQVSCAGAYKETSQKAVYCFTVSDTGIGMTQEFLKHIFEPFERERTPSVDAIEGTGLGMSIVKNILNEMGGTIEVQSEREKGSTFTVEVPLKILNPDTCDIIASRKNIAGMCLNFEGSRILLAEDDEINGEVACDILGRTHAEVRWVHDGAEAVTALLEAPEGFYDIVFMDIQMPHMNGLAASRALHEAGIREGRVIPPIVAMTANAYVEDKQKAFDVGMSAYLVKPFSLSDICHVLTEYLVGDIDENSVQHTK